MIDQVLGQLEDFDQAKAIDLREARLLVRGRNGPVSLEVLRRWLDPRRGCRVRRDAPPLVLPGIKVTGVWFVMPSWITAFERKRLELGLNVVGRRN